MNKKISIAFLLVLSILFISAVSASTITINSNQPIGNIKNNFYGTNTHGFYISNTSVDTNNDCTLDTVTNQSYHQSMFTASKMNYIRSDSSLDGQDDSTLQTWLFARYNKYYQTVNFSQQNGNKVLFLLRSMPSWLRNTSSGWCTGTNITCSPNNYTKWGELVVSFINYTTNGGQWNASVDVEVWNEPEQGSWLNNLSTDNIIKATEYMKLYNATYQAVKAVYPNMKVYGPATTVLGTNMLTTFISNMSAICGNSCSISYHNYDSPIETNTSGQKMNWILGNCTANGATCNDIVFDEWNDPSKSNKNTSANWANESSIIGMTYNNILNLYPSKVNLILYQWSELYKYYNNANASVCYPEYPQMWSMLSEPQLDNQVYSSYNVTKAFASTHKSGNTVLTSTSSDSEIGVTTSNDTTKEYITLINTNSSAKSNIAISGIFSNIRRLTDFDTGTAYGVIGGSANIPTLAGYGVMTLQSGSSYPISTSFVSPTPANNSVVASRNVTINASISTTNPIDYYCTTYNTNTYCGINPSLIVFYNFDNRSALGETNSLVYDLSNGGHNGTIRNNATLSNVTLTSGKYNNSYKFSGNLGDSINSSTALQITNYPFTIGAWINVSDNTTDQGVVTLFNGTSNYYGFGINSGAIRIVARNGTNIFADKGTINKNQWTRIDVVFTNSTNRQLYINGIATGTPDTQNSSFIGTLYPLIGQTRPTSAFYNGSIDDVMIWNTSLSSSQIAQNYNTSITRYDLQNYSLVYQINNISSNINSNYYYSFANDTSSNSVSSNNNTFRFLATTIVNFNQLISTINPTFYGISGLDTIRTDQLVSLDNDCTRETTSDYQSARSKVLASKVKLTRMEVDLSVNGINATTINVSSSIREYFNWAWLNNLSVTMLIDKTPTALQNRTSGWCNSTDWTSCSPNNYTDYANMIKLIYENVSNNGGYTNIKIEFFNEPYSIQWLNNLSKDNLIKATEYVKAYNETYNVLKTSYPNLKIGGGGSYYVDAPNMINTFLSNLTNRWDFIVYHQYYFLGAFNNTSIQNVQNATDWLYSRCTVYSANCSNIDLTEFNSLSDSLISHSNTQYLTNSWLYSNLLRSYASNVSTYLYKLDERYTNKSCDVDYNLSITDQTSNVNFSVYYSLSNYTRYAPSNYDLSNSSSNYDPIVSTCSNKSGTYNCILLNTNSDSDINVSLSTTGYTGLLIDPQSGTLYDLSSGSTNLGDVPSYGIKYLTTPDLVLVKGTGLVKANYLGEILATGNEIAISSETSSQTGKLYHITSNISSPVNITFRTTADCLRVLSVDVTPKNTSSYSANFTCAGNVLNVENVTIKYSADSNEIQVNYDGAVAEVCNDFFGAGTTFMAFVIVIAIVIIGAGLIFMLNGQDGEFDMTTATVTLIIAAIIISIGTIIVTKIGC